MKLFLINIALLYLLVNNCTREGPVAEKPKPSSKKDTVSKIVFEPVKYIKKHKVFFKDTTIKYSVDSIIYGNYDIIIHHFCEVGNYRGEEYIEDRQQELEILLNKRRVFISDSASFKEQIKSYRNYRNLKSKSDKSSAFEGFKNFDEFMDIWNSGNTQEFEFDTIKYFGKTEPPKLLVWGDTKGMHCCRQLFIFELGQNYRFVNIINSAYLDIENLSLKDIDSDGIPEITFYTNAWRFWRNSAGAEAPYFKTVLKYVNGYYHIFKEKMSKPMPDSTKINRWIRECRRLGDNINYQSTIWYYMLEMIYGGHYRQAMEFSEKAWPRKLKGFDNFKKEFLAKLNSVAFGIEMIEWGK